MLGQKRKAFTLIEMLTAIALLAITMALAFGTFAAVARAWERGTKLADNLGHGEFIMEQLASGLRSAFFPGSAPDLNNYGFLLEDQGEGAYAQDSISWVKTGPALLSPWNPMQAGPHRIMISIEHDEDNRPVIASRAWRPIQSQTEHFFDPMSIEPFFISAQVIGFDCRVSTNMTDEGWEWESVWTDKATNHIPKAVEISLVMEPLEKGDKPFELKRLVEIPASELSLTPFKIRSNVGRSQEPQNQPKPQNQPVGQQIQR